MLHQPRGNETTGPLLLPWSSESLGSAPSRPRKLQNRVRSAPPAMSRVGFHSHSAMVSSALHESLHGPSLRLQDLQKLPVLGTPSHQSSLASFSQSLRSFQGLASERAGSPPRRRFAFLSPRNAQNRCHSLNCNASGRGMISIALSEALDGPSLGLADLFNLPAPCVLQEERSVSVVGSSRPSTPAGRGQAFKRVGSSPRQGSPSQFFSDFVVLTRLPHNPHTSVRPASRGRRVPQKQQQMQGKMGSCRQKDHEAHFKEEVNIVDLETATVNYRMVLRGGMPIPKTRSGQRAATWGGDNLIGPQQKFQPAKSAFRTDSASTDDRTRVASVSPRKKPSVASVRRPLCGP